MVSWFITGTDTDVGKTVASIALLQALSASGYVTAAYKPVASGSDWQPEGWRNSDALLLQQACNQSLSYDEINPYTFAEPTSPHIASLEQQQRIDPNRLNQGLHQLQAKAERIIVEGAGGWLTPLSDEFTFADWVSCQQLPVILVVGMKLGCINHALLTQAAIKQAGLPLVGWIANHPLSQQHRNQEYLAYLTQHLHAPLLGEIPYLDQQTPLAALGGYVRLPDEAMTV